MRRACLVLLVHSLLFAAAASRAESEGELLFVEIPPGYTPAYQQATDQGMIQEFVLQGETVEKWSEMLTVQMFPPSRSVQRFYEAVDSSVKQACKDGSTHVHSAEKENGYPVRFFTIVCPTNLQTNMGEVTYVKAIDGRDKLYVVQKAWRTATFEPGGVPLTEAEIVKWTQYMRSISVCDDRVKARRCSAAE